MKKIFLAAMAFFALAQVQAQSAKNPTKNDPDAKKILDAVTAKFRSLNAPQASFTYQIENAQGEALFSKKGTVVMKGAKYHVAMPGMELFSDGRTSWNYDKSSNEVTVSPVEAGGGALTPQSLFTNFYDRNFYYKLNGERKVGAKSMQEIELTPTDKTMPFHKVYLLVDKAAQTIYSARFLEQSGGRYTYTITGLKSAPAVTDAEFTFNKSKYPGVEVVDLH